MKTIAKLLLYLAVIVTSFTISSKNHMEDDQTKFANSLKNAYDVVYGTTEANLGQDSDYYRVAMQDFANLFLEIPTHYNSLNDLEGDLQSMGSILCYRGNDGPRDFLLVHFNCPLPVFGTIESNWNYLFLYCENAIQCLPLYTQSNVSLNGIQIFEKDNILIYQLEGRLTNYHPLQLFLGFLTINEHGDAHPINISTKTEEGIIYNIDVETDIPIVLRKGTEMSGKMCIDECGLEFWLYAGLTAEVNSSGEVKIAYNEPALEKGVSGLTIARLDICADSVLVQCNRGMDSVNPE